MRCRGENVCRRRHGILYTRYGYSKENTVHATNQHAGGYCGIGGGDNMTVTGCNITADDTYAGGVSPNTGHGCSSSVVTGCNIRAGSYAGGLTGRHTAGTYGVIIRDCAIYADEYAGGVFSAKGAETADHYLFNSIVTNCKIGRTTKEYPEVEKSPGDPDHYTPQWKQDNGRGTRFAGGLAGYFTLEERPVDPEDGSPVADEASGYQDMLHKDYFERIIMAQTSVTSSTGSMGILAQNDKAVQTSGDGGVGYLRVYENLMYGTESAAHPIRNQRGALGTFPTWTYGDPDTSEIQYREDYLVTTEDMKDLDFYYGTKAKGGLYIKENTYNYWDAQNSVLINTTFYRNFCYSADVKAKGLFPYVTNLGSYVLVSAWLEEAALVQDGIPIPDGASGISTLSLGDLSESLDQYPFTHPESEPSTWSFRRMWPIGAPM